MDLNFPALGQPDRADLPLLQAAATAWAAEPESPLWMRRRFRLWRAALQGTPAMRDYLLGEACPFPITLEDPLTAQDHSVPPSVEDRRRMPTPLGWATHQGLMAAFEDLVARGASVTPGVALWPSLVLGVIGRGAQGQATDPAWADRLDQAGAPRVVTGLARQLLVAHPDLPNAPAWFDAVMARSAPTEVPAEDLLRALRTTLKRTRYRPGGSPQAVHRAAETWWPRLMAAGLTAADVDPMAEALIQVCGMVTHQTPVPMAPLAPAPLKARRYRHGR